MAGLIVNMSDEELERYDRVLRPKGASTSGFYGAKEDIRALGIRDDTWVTQNGTTHEILASKLEKFLQTLSVGEGMVQYLGYQHCPFESASSSESLGFGCSAKGSRHYHFFVNGKAYTCGDLLPHLIRAHGCYEGEEIPSNNYDKTGGMRVPPSICAQL